MTNFRYNHKITKEVSYNIFFEISKSSLYHICKSWAILSSLDWQKIRTQTFRCSLFLAIRTIFYNSFTKPENIFSKIKRRCKKELRFNFLFPTNPCIWYNNFLILVQIYTKIFSILQHPKRQELTIYSYFTRQGQWHVKISQISETMQKNRRKDIRFLSH